MVSLDSNEGAITILVQHHEGLPDAAACFQNSGIFGDVLPDISHCVPMVIMRLRANTKPIVYPIPFDDFGGFSTDPDLEWRAMANLFCDSSQ
jgi:hypothetical protein